MKNWQAEAIKTIQDGLKSGKTEDEILVDLGKKSLDMSLKQFDYYLKKARQFQKHRIVKKGGWFSIERKCRICGKQKNISCFKKDDDVCASCRCKVAYSRAEAGRVRNMPALRK